MNGIAMGSGRRRSLHAVTASGLMLLVLSGCHKKTQAPPPPPPAATVAAPTATLTGEPLAIDLGQSVVLTWKTTNATSVSIDGIGDVSTSGTQSVTPSNSTNFHLLAKGDGGTGEANVRITVRVPAAPTNTGASTNLDDTSDAAFHAAVQDVYFDYDSYDLRPDAQTNATQAAAYLTQHPAMKVVIGGYCDERGSAEYNLALGENRANAAKQALVGAGVSPSRVRVISYGKEKQFCTEADESCYRQNRRAQFNMDR